MSGAKLSPELMAERVKTAEGSKVVGWRGRGARISATINGLKCIFMVTAASDEEIAAMCTVMGFDLEREKCGDVVVTDAHFFDHRVRP